MTAVNINDFDLAAERLIIEGGVYIVFGYDARVHSARAFLTPSFEKNKYLLLREKGDKKKINEKEHSQAWQVY